MPDRVDRALFVAGLVLFLGALVLVFTFGAGNRTETRIDHSHWSMLAGSVFMLPFAVKLRRNLWAVAGSIMLTAGIVGVIGMCVIDLVFWGIADDALRDAVAAELVAIPSIWWPFMLYGPEEVLYSGMVLASACYWRWTRAGTAFVTLGAILAIAGPTWFNVAGAASVLLGFLIDFRAVKEVAEKA
ncbi:MAG: hypothetical protein R3C97_00955 [Geminicoccaceae bacterium]